MYKENLALNKQQWLICHKKPNKPSNQKNEKASWNQALQKKSHRKNKQLISLPCKILWTILNLDKGENQTNGTKDNKVDNYAEEFTHKRRHSQTIYIKKRRKGHASIEVCIDTSIQTLEKYSEKSKERLIAAATE